jgi:hypothetical protein
MPYSTIVAGTTVSAAVANTNWRDQVVSQFATSAARDSAITAPVEGMVAYLADADTLVSYDGSTWVQFAQLGAWSTYTPALTAASSNPTLGSGSSATGSYVRIGRTIIGRCRLAFGTSGTAAGSGAYRVSLPVTPVTPAAVSAIVGSGSVRDASSGNSYVISCVNGSGDTFITMNADTTQSVSDSAPFAWSTQDAIGIEFTYEATS